VDAVQKLAAESAKAFESAMEDDMNTSPALTELMKFVTRINQYAASDKLTKDMADAALPVLARMMGILGLKASEPDDSEKKEIESLVAERNRLRADKKFREADEARKRLLEERSVELFDHKGRTVWAKRERIPSA
jgi:cysteinyl-tRNA synthetase